MEIKIFKHKKGIYFTFVAIFLVLLIISVINSKDKYRYRAKSRIISKRVRSMNNFIRDMEDDLSRQLFIGGYRGLLSLQKHIRNKEGYIEDLDIAFTEIFMNGTANGTIIDIMRQEGQGADFNSWKDRINEEAEKLNIEVGFVPNKIHLTMDSPWSVLIILNLSINVTDTKNLAYWKYNKTFTRIINITGFEDPLYTVNTDDQISNLISPTVYTDFVDDATNETDNLKLHLNNSYYVSSITAPDFLMRFTGNLSNSSFGIESMVDLTELQKQDIDIKNKTLIDYIYFSNQTTSDYCNIYNMQNWFRIDQEHANYYEIDILEKNSC